MMGSIVSKIRRILVISFYPSFLFGNDFHLPSFIDPKSNDLMVRPMVFQAVDSIADLLTVYVFLNQVAAAVIMADHKKSGGFIDINRNSNTAQHFTNVFLFG